MLSVKALRAAAASASYAECAALLNAAADEIEYLRSDHKHPKTWQAVLEHRRRQIERLTPDQRQVFDAMESVAEKMGFTWDQLAGKGKSGSVCRAREAVWPALYDTGLSYPAIGRLYGKHHTAIMLACRRAKNNQETHNKPLDSARRAV